MRSKVRIIIVVIIIGCLVGTMYYFLYASPYNWGDWNRIKPSEGISLLTVFFKNDSNNYNVTEVQQTLNFTGYNVSQNENRNGSTWSLSVIWLIPDKNYTDKYPVKSFEIFLYVFLSSNNTLSKSSIVVSISENFLSDDISKKTWDKELTKKAAYEIAACIDIDLDWDRHFYIVHRAEMTEVSSYREK